VLTGGVWIEGEKQCESWNCVKKRGKLMNEVNVCVCGLFFLSFQLCVCDAWLSSWTGRLLCCV